MNAPALAETKSGSIWSAWWRLRRFWLPHWPAIALGLLVLAGIAAVELLKPWPLKFVFDEILGHGPLEGGRLAFLIAIVALVVVIATLDGLLAYLLVYLLQRAGRTIVFEVRVALFDHLHRLSLQYHSRRATGDLLLRVTSDVQALRDVVTVSVAEIMVSVLFLVGMAVVLFVLDWPLALVAMAGTPLMAVAMYHYVFKIKEFAQAEREKEGALASVASEALGAIRLTRVFNRERETARRFQEESAASLESGFAASLREERASWAITVLAAVSTAAVLLFGVQRVVEGVITVGTLIVFVSYVTTFHRPIRTIAKQASKVSKATAKIERVAELLEVEQFVSDRPGARPAPPLRGQIEFRGVTFAYEDGEPALKDVDLVLPAGKVTAVVGPTGAGKTTLVSLIPRLYDPTEGAVLIDGHDVRDFTLDSLRAQIGVVLQESVLLRASVAENIAYGKPSASQAEVEAAAKAANAHEFILALPDGYRTEVGERGETLSGGQRQRIAIARAILRDAPIVLLDEPLTGLDEASQDVVLDALERLTHGRTVIVISHQSYVTRRADAVVLLEDGRVVSREGAPEVHEREPRPRSPRRVVRQAAESASGWSLFQTPMDLALPDLHELVGGEDAPAFVTEAVRELGAGAADEQGELLYVRYHPAHSCIALWSFGSGNCSPLLVSGTLFADDRGAALVADDGYRRLAAEASTAAGAGSSYRYLADRRLLLQLFPLDAKLPELPAAASAERVERALAENGAAHRGIASAQPAMLSYKPWRRCVMRYGSRGPADLDGYVGKVFRDDRGGAALTRQQVVRAQLTAAGAPWISVAPAAYLPGLRLLLLDAVPGAVGYRHLFEDAVDDAPAREALRAYMTRTAAGLLAFRNVRLNGVERVTPSTLLERLEARRRSLAHVLPVFAEAVAARLRRLEEEAARLRPEPVGLAHGAFRHNQLLLAGDQLVLADLDTLCCAEASLDAGEFLACLDRNVFRRPHLRAVMADCEQAFVAGLEAEEPPCPSWLAWHRAASQVKLAVRSVLSLAPGWPETVDGLLRLSESTLADASRTKVTVR